MKSGFWLVNTQVWCLPRFRKFSFWRGLFPWGSLLLFFDDPVTFFGTYLPTNNSHWLLLTEPLGEVAPKIWMKSGKALLAAANIWSKLVLQKPLIIYPDGVPIFNAKTRFFFWANREHSGIITRHQLTSYRYSCSLWFQHDHNTGYISREGRLMRRPEKYPP